MRKRSKVILIILVALLLSGAAATVAFSQPEESTQLASERQCADQPPRARLADQLRNMRRRHRVRLLMNEALADELNISVEELTSARQDARVTAIQQAAEEGLITAERAELFLARRTMREYIQFDEFIAEVLGISVEELEAAREDGKNVRQLAIELGLDWQIIKENIRITWEGSVHQAEVDGVITPDQAELLLKEPPGLRSDLLRRICPRPLRN